MHGTEREPFCHVFFSFFFRSLRFPGLILRLVDDVDEGPAPEDGTGPSNLVSFHKGTLTESDAH